MELNLNRKGVLSCFLLTAVFNTVIALFLTQMDFGTGFRKTFILSQSIGLSICAAVLSGLRFVRNPSASGQMVTVLGGIALGATAGSFLGSLLAGIPFAAVIEGRPGLLQMLLAGLFFGIVVTSSSPARRSRRPRRRSTLSRSRGSPWRKRPLKAASGFSRPRSNRTFFSTACRIS